MHNVPVVTAASAKSERSLLKFSLLMGVGFSTLVLSQTALAQLRGRF